MTQPKKIQESEFNINDPRCVRCGSSKLRNIGRHGNRKRYQCQDCRRCFSGEEFSKPVSLNIKEISPICPRCNSNNLRKNGCSKKIQKQQYQCKDCRKYFDGGAYVKTERPLAYDGNNCPKCKSFDVRPYGKDKLTKKQKYLCNNCGRSFAENTKKEEMEKFWDGRVLNNQGEVVVSANPELDTAEMQWIKKNMKAQTLPDGFCGLPVTKSCPVQASQGTKEGIIVMEATGEWTPLSTMLEKGWTLEYLQQRSKK